NEARRGVNGFGHFCRNKSGSAAGPKPDLTPPTKLHQRNFCTFFNGLGSMAEGCLNKQVSPCSQQPKRLGQEKKVSQKFLRTD
ncbi:MAG: hypothetical protein ABI618_10325, partial [Nitrospirota bacterium]